MSIARRSGVFWLLLTAIVVGGTIAFTAVITYTVMAPRGDFATLTAPGEETLELSRRGNYTVYLVIQRTEDSRGEYRPEGLDRLQFSLTHADTGAPVALKAPASTHRVAHQRTVREPIRAFHVAEPGPHRFAVAHDADAQSGPVELLLRRDFGNLVFDSLLRGAVVLLITAALLGVTAYAMPATQRAG